MGKRLDYEDDSPFPTAASLQQPMLAPEGLADLAPLLELPDPNNASSNTVVYASDADAKHAMTASVDSTVTEVRLPTDSDLCCSSSSDCWLKFWSARRGYGFALFYLSSLWTKFELIRWKLRAILQGLCRGCFGMLRW